MSSILTGVRYLHSYRVVHRDLKPEKFVIDEEEEKAMILSLNFVFSILMDSTMNVKITDLGFAVQVTDNDSLFDLFGTPGKPFVRSFVRFIVFVVQVTWPPNYFVVLSQTTIEVTVFRLIFGLVELFYTHLSVVFHHFGIENNI